MCPDEEILVRVLDEVAKELGISREYLRGQGHSPPPQPWPDTSYPKLPERLADVKVTRSGPDVCIEFDWIWVSSRDSFKAMLMAAYRRSEIEPGDFSFPEGAAFFERF